MCKYKYHIYSVHYFVYNVYKHINIHSKHTQ